MNSRLRNNRILRQVKEDLDFFKLLRQSRSKSLINLIREFEIEYVFDIGANIGQFSLGLLRSGYEGTIFSFEPVTKVFDTLSQNASKHLRWSAFKQGMGARSETRIISISNNNGLSSSFRKMQALHLNNFPESFFSSQEEVSLTTFDDQIKSIGISPQKCLIKIDVQGFENEVLAGAENSLPLVPVCYLESSLFPLYEGESDFRDLINLLHSHNHQLFDIFPAIRGKKGQLLQVDFITLRKFP